jgi:hypothetical protein
VNIGSSDPRTVCPGPSTKQAQPAVRRKALGEGEMIKRKLGSFILCAMLLALCASAEAQQPTKVPRIGYLSSGSASGITGNLESVPPRFTKVGLL